MKRRFDSCLVVNCTLAILFKRMTGTKELGLPNRSSISLRERAARTTLHSVRMQGHTYVELREGGKGFIFFCTLCLSPCYSESVLFDHLKGHMHSQRFAAAKVTLLQSNPWPFNDGVHFFYNLIDDDHPLTDFNVYPAVTSLENSDNVKCFDIVSHNGNAETSKANLDSVDGLYDSNIDGFHGTNSCGIGGGCDMLILNVLIKDRIADLDVKFIGFGKLGARVREVGVSKRMSGIWCEWLGNTELSDEDFFEIPENDFAIVVFSYDNDLGRSLVDDVRYLLAQSSPNRGVENVESQRKNEWKSYSGSEDINYPLNSLEESSWHPGLNPHNDQLSCLQNISHRTLRRELRCQHRVRADRMCDICQHKMLPGKDVSALMNIRTQRLVCSSRNISGAFHVFHTSCLINWILLCESEIYSNNLVSAKSKVRQKSKKCGTATKNKAKSKVGDTESSPGTQIFSVFCPECQGTGLKIEGQDDMERPTFPLSEVFKFKLKSSDAHRAWMKNPEVLQNCSTGFNFPPQLGETGQEVVFPLKLLQFYRAHL